MLLKVVILVVFLVLRFGKIIEVVTRRRNVGPQKNFAFIHSTCFIRYCEDYI